MLTLGVDLGADARKTACCVINWSTSAAVVEHVETGLDDAALLAHHGRVEVTGIDCPFGWPNSFLKFLTTLRDPTRVRPWTPDRRDQLRFRTTDRWIRSSGFTGRWPLSVSSDLIAVVAMRCHGLLANMNVTDRSGDGRVYEVYPAAALAQWGLPASKYKRGPGAREVRQEIVTGIRASAPWLGFDGKAESAVVRSDHALDALVSSLVARAAKLDLVVPAEARNTDVGREEGWIAVPEELSLGRLLGCGA